MRVLVVEDEKKTAAFVCSALRQDGFAVDHVSHGNEVMPLVEATCFGVVVLDIMLPGRDGLSLLRQMRERRISTPVILLSARGDVSEKVAGLDAGADDYLPKPFALAELTARIRALGRRSNNTGSVVLRVADLTLDTIARKAIRGSKSIELTTREYMILEFLMKANGQVCGRMAIVESVWNYDFDPGSNLAISNTGGGIPAASLPKIFDRFYRGDRNGEIETEGCGLGLSVVDWIAKGHFASIDVRSDPLTETVFTLKFPLMATRTCPSTFVPKS